MMIIWKLGHPSLPYHSHEKCAWLLFSSIDLEFLLNLPYMHRICAHCAQVYRRILKFLLCILLLLSFKDMPTAGYQGYIRWHLSYTLAHGRQQWPASAHTHFMPLAGLRKLASRKPLKSQSPSISTVTYHASLISSTCTSWSLWAWVILPYATH